MKKEIDCQLFEDQLETLVGGTLSDEGVEQLRAHSRSCAACAMQLRVHEHLVRPSLEELEAAVPQHLVNSVWPRLRSGMARETKHTGRPRKASWLRTWQVPVMAAASVVLLFGSGFLFAQLRQSEARERTLAQELSRQRRLVAEIGASGSSTSGIRTAARRTAALGGGSNWVRALTRQEGITVDELQIMLRRVPGSTTLISSSELDAVLANASSWTPPAWRAVLQRLEEGEDLQADDLLRLLESLDVPPETRVPTSRLVQMLN